jgi:NAD(P)-dependent dehydrogenase (short-subunit alcohol dehydrogenase family)
MAEPPRLYGLKAIVTTAATGIGEAVTRTLIKHGATVLAVDSANSGVEQQFRGVKDVITKTANLRDPAGMPALVDEAAKALGRVDILVNEFPLKPEAPLDDEDKGIGELTDARAGLLSAMCRAALPYLKKSPSGRIINIGFLRSLFSARGAKAFAQAERDLAAQTRALAAEIGEFGITANYVQPGAIMTPVSREVFRKDIALRDYFIAHSASQRLGEAVDVAKVVLFLASDDAAFVNGAGIAVDGGRKDP